MKVATLDTRRKFRTSRAIKRIAIPSGKVLIFSLLIAVIMVAAIAASLPNGSLRYILSNAENLSLMIKRSGFYGIRRDLSPLAAVTKLPARYFRSFSPVDVPTLMIDVKFKHLQKIQKKRAEALHLGRLDQGPDDFVPMSIRLGKEKIKAKMRLKGDLLDHIQHENKWSFRIHVKGKDQIFGLRRFSIQHPMARNFYAEALYLETLRHVGVLAPRYFFVRVLFNGDDIGLMAVEEHFSKELLEANRRRESVILRFDETLKWRTSQNGAGGRKASLSRPFNSFRNVPVDGFRSSKIRKSARLSQDYATAVGLLRGFAAHELKASQVFDTELTGRFLAATELWASRHALYWNNLRFYFNPITAKLEPIGYDGGGHQPPTDASLVTLGQGEAEEIGMEPIVRDWLADPLIFKAYVTALRNLAGDVVNGSLVDKLRQLERRQATLLQREFMLLDDFSFEKFGERAKSLLKLRDTQFRAGQQTAAALIHAYMVRRSGRQYLEIMNAVPHSVEIRSIVWRRAGEHADLQLDVQNSVNFPIRLAPMYFGAPSVIKRIPYSPLPGKERYKLHILAAIEGEAKLYDVSPQISHALLSGPVIPNSTVKAQLKQHSFLREDASRKTLAVESGAWRVEGSLIVPKGYSLKIGPGTNLRFSPNAALISHGPLLFQGTKEDPVRLTSQGNQTWQGVAVMAAGAQSSWTHVIVRNTSGVSAPNWRLTGGVTFYESNVRIDDSSFIGNRGEDALNIVRSKFELRNVNFHDTASDAFDADFSEGGITGGLFRNIGTSGGGDGFDISGSITRIDGARFEHIGDKALSVGERSRMTADNITMIDTGVAAASKDGSVLRISNSEIVGARIAGLMAYVKKPEYGAGAIDANNIKFTNVPVRARVQTRSSIVIDGDPVESEDVNVDALYKTVMKKGRTGKGLGQ